MNTQNGSGTSPLARLHLASTRWPLLGRIAWWLLLLPLALAACSAARLTGWPRRAGYVASVLILLLGFAASQSDADPAPNDEAVADARPLVSPQTPTSTPSTEPVATSSPSADPSQAAQAAQAKRAEEAAAERQAAAQEQAQRVAARKARVQARQEARAVAQKKKKRAAARAKRRSEQAAASVYYENCTAVEDAGAAPIRAGEPGYSFDLDRDRDGIACEQ